MGALLGLTFGLGLLLIWQSALGPRRSRGTRRGPRVLHRIADMIAEAGIEAVTPRQVVVSCAGAGLFVALASLVVATLLFTAISHTRTFRAIQGRP